GGRVQCAEGRALRRRAAGNARRFGPVRFQPSDGRPRPAIRSETDLGSVITDVSGNEGNMMENEILLAQPRGFCAGVDRAIEIVERALKQFGAPIYVRHEIVHNAYVVEDLRNKGAIFIEELEDVPPGNTLVFSAHGVSKAVRLDAEARGLTIFDATCPLVTKVHVEVAKMRKQGCEIIMIGHDGH